MTPPDTSDSRSLSRILADWRVTPPRDPHFRTAVWSRLEAARRPSSWPAFARAHRPVLTGALAAALVIGAWAGREQARARVDHERDGIARAYVQSLDARVMQLP
jgi:hypothetical protein